MYARSNTLHRKPDTDDEQRVVDESEQDDRGEGSDPLCDGNAGRREVGVEHRGADAGMRDEIHHRVAVLAAALNAVPRHRRQAAAAATSDQSVFAAVSSRSTSRTPLSIPGAN